MVMNFEKPSASGDVATRPKTREVSVVSPAWLRALMAMLE